MADEGFGLLLVLEARELDDEAIFSEFLDAGLGDTELVHPTGDVVDEASHLVFGGLEALFARLIDEVDTTNEVETEAEPEGLR